MFSKNGSAFLRKDLITANIRNLSGDSAFGNDYVILSGRARFSANRGILLHRGHRSYYRGGEYTPLFIKFHL